MTPVPTIPEKPTDNEVTLYNEELAIYKEDDKRYKQHRAGLSAIWRVISQSVASGHLDWLTNASDTEPEIYRKLEEDLALTLETRMIRIEERYHKLGTKPANQSVQNWLNEWEKVISKCIQLGMTQYTRYMGTRLFVTALKKIEPSYGNIRSN